MLQYIYNVFKTIYIVLLLFFLSVTNYVAIFSTNLPRVHGTCDLLSNSYYPINFFI